ncbi:metallophosphoesterase family protein [Ornithinibacillus halophilus]|uniref:Phosphoesterase, MJ0936 family n=1 Tax=Ornithinibacillus halophilus TaxID=930117 RepID=A0A1M5HQZ3_9BACI|nr:metallophosphoesterase family protein [Ornithinibacillus halophilus]SHG18288.1 phosphoesterase, MJ0936 family [Ornithinibacillus halophilus]
MKFAVITDIHGNSHALQAVLNDIDLQTDIHYIYCLGDMIAIGPDTNEVLEILFSRDDVSMITGNHDEAVIALLNGEPYPDSHRHVIEHHQWIANQLNPKYIEKLSTLPRIIKENIQGISIIYSHYYIDASNINVPIHQDPFHSIVEPSLQNMDSLFEPYDADLICFGHHHPRHYFRGDKKTYLNPGSLGCQHDAIAPYAIVNIERNAFSIDIREVPYNKIDFLREFEKQNIPEKEFILKTFYGI